MKFIVIEELNKLKKGDILIESKYYSDIYCSHGFCVPISTIKKFPEIFEAMN
jgi:hypothetical protein